MISRYDNYDVEFSVEAQQGPTVYVVDDDPAVCKSTCWLIESVGLNVETCCSAREFLDRYNPDMPGCVVLDVRMPEMSGIELQEKLAADRVDVPLIMVTGHGEVPIAVRAMGLGAIDFLEKPFRDQLLLDRIHQALEIDSRARNNRFMKASIISRLEHLSPRENEVLELVMEGLFNKQIAHRLGIHQKTVEVHRANVMGKLSAESLVHLVRLVLLARPELDE